MYDIIESDNSYYMIQKILANLKVCNRYLKIP